MLLDVLLRREPFYRSSARVWTLAETGAHAGFVSAISFNNVFYLLRKQGGSKPTTSPPPSTGLIGPSASSDRCFIR